MAAAPSHAQLPAPPAPPAPRPPVIVRPAREAPTPSASPRRFPLVAAQGPWALPRPGRIVGGPDWSNYAIYPPGALEREQEGAVTFVLQVTPEGRARACAIAGSSGFAELDDGTCVLALEMRFEPRRDDSGRAVDSTYRGRITWLLGDQLTLAPGRLAVSFALVGGHAEGCRAEGRGGVPPAWARSGCRIVAGDPRFFLGEGLAGARRATVVVTLRPPRDATIWTAPAGTRLAVRRTEFLLSKQGDPSECRTAENRGFGTPRFDYSGPCGLFLTQAWLRPAEGQTSTDRGAVEIESYVER
jgi:TonB family protein